MVLETLSEPFPHPNKPAPGLGTPVPQTVGGVASAEGSARAPERRRHVRIGIAARRPTTVNINDKNAALVVNLGAGGMRVQALGRRVEPGATLRLEFPLPGSPEPVRASSVVAWVNDSAEAGIRFAELSESLAHRLRRWMAENGVLNAAREFMSIAGGWQAALDLMAELARMLTGARGVAITLAVPGKPPIHSSVGEDLPTRATVAAPIYESERIIGHLEISSTELGAFDEQDLGALPVLAAVVGKMVELRAIEPQEAAHKAPPLSARIVSRIEGIFPTIRVRIVP